jgi:hypothetical protein
MKKKKLTQKLNQLSDIFKGIKRAELENDILALKLSEDDKLELTLAKKYYEN